MGWMTRAATFLERLPSWAKIVAAILFFSALFRGAWAHVEDGITAVKGFAPLETQFRGHVKDYETHVDTAEIVRAKIDGDLREVDNDLHTLLEQNRVIQEQQGQIIEKLDTVSTEQRWLDCMRLRDRDREAGRPSRDCRPFGGGVP